MSQSLNLTSKNSSGEKVTKKLSNVNPDAADSSVALFAAHLANLSNDTLENIERVENEEVEITVGNEFSGGIVNTRAGVKITVADTTDTQKAAVMNFANNVSIQTGAGNDSIYNTGNNVLINSGSGTDKIYTTGENVSVRVDINQGTNIVSTATDTKLQLSFDDSPHTINTGDYSDIGKAEQIYGGAGGNVIQNTIDSIYISSGDGDDTISNSGDTVTIDAGTGNDYIYNTGNSVSIRSSAGDDYIENSGEKVSIDAGYGNDSIFNSGDFLFIKAENYAVDSGNKFIQNTGNNCSLNTAAGNDTVINSGTSVYIYSANGDDTIFNYGDDASINAGNQLDYIYNTGNRVSIYSSANADTVISRADNVTIAEYSDSDYFYIEGNNNRVSLDGSYSVTAADAATIIGDSNYVYSRGNSDLIVANGKNNSYAFSAGPATIRGFSENDTFIWTNTVSPSTAEIFPVTTETVTGGTFVHFAGYKVFLEGTNFSPKVVDNSTAPKATPAMFVANSGADTITVTNEKTTYTKNNKTYTLTGKTLQTYGGVNAGAGADKITVKSGTAGLSIAGGHGNDYIYIEDNDTANIYVFNQGDGKDTITGLGERDVINIVTTTYANGVELPGSGSYTISDHVLVSLNADPSNPQTYLIIGSRHILLEGKKYDDTVKVKLNERDIETITIPRVLQGTIGVQTIYNTLPGYDHFTIDAAGGNDTVINNQSFVSINGGSGANCIIVEANSGTEADGVTIRGGAGNDTIDVTQNTNTQGKRTKGVVYEFGTADGSNTIQGYCGEDSIVFDGFDDTAIQTITGTINIYGNCVVHAGSTRITLIRTADKKYLGGTKLNLYSVSDSTVTELTASLPAGTEPPAWLSNMATPVKDNTGNITHFELPKKILEDNAGHRTYYDSDYDNFTIDAAGGRDTVTLDGVQNVSLNSGAGYDFIVLRNTKNVTVCGNYGDDTIDARLDSDTAHIFQFNSESGEDYILGYNESDSIFITDDTPAESIKGYFDTSDFFVISLANSASINCQLSDNFRGGKKLNIIDKNGAAIPFTYAEYQYFDADQKYDYDPKYQTYYIPKILMGSNSLAEEPPLVNTDDNFTIKALKGNDVIINSGSNVYIDAGEGNDTIYLTSTLNDDGSRKYGQNVTVYGGKGNDVIYSEVFIDGDAVTLDSDATIGHTFIFRYPEGSDTIYNFSHNDTIAIQSDSRLINASVSGNDLILNFGVADTENTRIYSSITAVDASNIRILRIKTADDEVKLFNVDNNAFEE